MKFIETLFLGFLIACAALIAQVFFEVIAEIFFHTEIIIRYSPTDTTQHILFIMLIAATIEESIRYLFIKKRTSIHIQNSFRESVIYGILLGTGFVTLEIIFGFFSGIILTAPIISIISVASIHILLSIFLLYVTTHKRTVAQDIPFIIIAILLHVCGNFLLLYYI